MWTAEFNLNGKLYISVAIMSGTTVTTRFSDNYELKEELGKYGQRFFLNSIQFALHYRVVKTCNLKRHT